MSSDKNNLSESDTEYEPFSDEEPSENNTDLIENSITIKEKKENQINLDNQKDITNSKQLSRNKLLRILSRR